MKYLFLLLFIWRCKAYWLLHFVRCCLARSGQTMTEGRTRRLQKLQQLWAQVVSSVEAERRVRTADVSSVASVDPRSSSSSSTVNARCLQQRLSNGERVPDEDERRYYCPELCNTGIFRRRPPASFPSLYQLPPPLALGLHVAAHAFFAASFSVLFGLLRCRPRRLGPALPAPCG